MLYHSNMMFLNRCKFLLSITLILSPFFASAQILKGSISDDIGQPIPMATIYIKELQLGTSADEMGEFELQVPKGTYTCVFQSIGYTTKNEQVKVTAQGVTLNVIMSVRAYEIKPVVVSKNREDPAYRIMRHVIGMAPYYSNQVSNYTADVYIKGSARIDKISRLTKIAAKDELKRFNIKAGTAMLMESVNEITFNAPDEFKHKVVSTNNTLPEDFQQLNTMNFVAANIYNTNIVAQDAFSNYRFSYEAFTEDGDLYICKIKVTPRKKSPLLVSGYIYIIEDNWQVYSVDLSGEMQFGKYWIKANFNEVKPNVYLPTSYNLEADVKVIGNTGFLDYAVTMRYRDVVINTDLKNPLSLTSRSTTVATNKTVQPTKTDIPQKTLSRSDSIKQQKRMEEIGKLLERDELNNREMNKLTNLMKDAAEEQQEKSLNLSSKYQVVVDSNARNVDSSQWNAIRPIPLRQHEIQSYKAADSIKAIEEGRDTSTRKQNIVRNLLIGHRIKLGKSSQLYYRGLLDVDEFAFNSVDGFRYGQRLNFRKTFENQTILTSNATAWWAFNRKDFMWQLHTQYLYYPEKRARVYLNISENSIDYNNHTRPHSPTFSAVTLLTHNNYTRLYEHLYIRLGNVIDITNGLELAVELSYNDRWRIENSTNFAFTFPHKKYKDNTPENSLIQPDFTLGKATIAYVTLNYTPQYFYHMRGRRKFMAKSDYPTFSLQYTKGIKNFLGSNADFDMLKFSIRQSRNIGILSNFQYSLEGVKFFNSKSVDFPDFHHFRISGFPIYCASWTDEYARFYKYSTNDWGASAFVRYTDPFILLKYLPGLRDTYWRENVQAQYIYTPHAGHYTEFRYSISEILLLIELGVFVSFDDLNFNMVGLTINFHL